MGVLFTETGPTAHAHTVRIDLLLADDFVLTEVAGIVDVLMIANRVSVKTAFEWRYLSLNGGIKHSRTGVMIDTHPISPRPDVDYLFVLGNSDPHNPALSVRQHVSNYTFRNAQVFLLAEAASRYIREAGDEAGAHTTHWENSAMMQEGQGVHQLRGALAVQDGAVVTCAGMEATVDVTLGLIGRYVSAAAKMTVADILLHEKIRDFGTQQPFGGAGIAQTGDPELDMCLELMQANIEEPLPINELVRVLGMSNRSLERKFRMILGTTPNTYYREMRLSRANNLLLNTTLSIREIGLACGFGGGFSGLYKRFFGVTPLAVRKQHRVARPKSKA